jgi:hypothetical protein
MDMLLRIGIFLLKGQKVKYERKGNQILQKAIFHQKRADDVAVCLSYKRYCNNKLREKKY